MSLSGPSGENVPAYLTIYLALTLTVLLSLYLALIEGARDGGIRLETECVTDIGLNSIFAEYHRELLEQYNLFAIDISYGTRYAGSENVSQHLRQYLDRNLSLDRVFLSGLLYRDFLGMSVEEAEITRASVLTDHRGAIFRGRAVEAMQADVGLVLLEEILQWMQVVEAHDLDTRNVGEEKREADQEIERILEYAETEETVENPTDWLEETRRTGILGIVTEDAESLSHRQIHTDSLISARMERGAVNRGNFFPNEVFSASELTDRFFFQEYLMKYMGHYGKESEKDALLYQMEYLIAGQDQDLENLRGVVNRLCLLREAANAVYIFSDAEKCAEAELVATVLSSLVQLPELAGPLKLTILLGWAFAESLYDVETLLAGGRVPLIKEREDWHYSLWGNLQSWDRADGARQKGLAYEDYLRIFMMLTDLETLTDRAMDMVEADIRQTPGNQNFRLDGCYDRVEACIRFVSTYGYEYVITRSRGY